MPPEVLNSPDFFSSLLGGSTVFVLLIAAIKWLDKDRAKTLMTLEAERRERLILFEALHTERYNELKRQAEVCAQDRERLSAKLDDLETRFLDHITKKQ